MWLDFGDSGPVRMKHNRLGSHICGHVQRYRTADLFDIVSVVGLGLLLGLLP